MRNFDEILAEIDRRSKVLCAQKKRRQRLLLTCVPLVLCVGLWAVYPRQKEVSQPCETTDLYYSNTETKPAALTGGGTTNVLYCAEVTMEDRSSYRVQDEATLIELSTLCQTLVSQIENDDLKYGITLDTSATVNPGIIKPENQPVKDAGTDSFRLTLVYADGTAVQYRLQDGVLENSETGTQFFLTEQQLQDLLSLLEP